MSKADEVLLWRRKCAAVERELAEVRRRAAEFEALVERGRCSMTEYRRACGLTDDVDGRDFFLGFWDGAASALNVIGGKQ